MAMEVSGGVEARENTSNDSEKLPKASEDNICVRNQRVGGDQHLGKPACEGSCYA